MKSITLPVARAALDALRTGVVNSAVARHFAYGREGELSGILAHIDEHGKGSAQLVIGGYGVGKTHLTYVLAHQLMRDGYAVARLEMGASHGRAEQPRAVIRTIEQSIAIQISGRTIVGDRDVLLALDAREIPRRGSSVLDWDYETRLLGHRDFPGSENILKRYTLLREAHREREAQGYYYLGNRRLFNGIPSAMTAVNYAVRSINGASHKLVDRGLKGLVLLLDESERTEWAESYYRSERARDLMLGLAIAAENRDTSKLKHYRNERWRGYLAQKPSRFHVVYLFSSAWGLANEIERTTRGRTTTLQPLSSADRMRLMGRIGSLYRYAYGEALTLNGQERKIIEDTNDLEDVRTLVRSAVGAYDAQQWRRIGT